MELWKTKAKKTLTLTLTLPMRPMREKLVGMPPAWFWSFGGVDGRGVDGGWEVSTHMAGGGGGGGGVGFKGFGVRRVDLT